MFPKTSDKYHKWVEWSEENQTYLGKCPASLLAFTVLIPARSTVICAGWWRMLFSILNLKVVVFLHRESDLCLEVA